MQFTNEELTDYVAGHLSADRARELQQQSMVDEELSAKLSILRMLFAAAGRVVRWEVNPDALGEAAKGKTFTHQPVQPQGGGGTARSTEGHVPGGQAHRVLHDVSIQESCITALAKIAALRLVDVTHSEGKIVLRGTVQSYYYKQLAEQTVREVASGREVVNFVRVVPRPPQHAPKSVES